MRRSCFSRSGENLNDVLSLLSHLDVDAVARASGWRLRRRKLPLSTQLSLWVRAMWRGGHASLATMVARHNLGAPEAMRVTEQALSKLDCTRPWEAFARLDRYPGHPKKHAVRVIEQCQPDGSWWRWCTNVMDADALPTELVPAVYRLRWRIEIFFRQMKQMLGLKRVHSMNVNAVLVELFCALIAYLVMHWLVRRTATEFPLPPTRRYCLRRACRLVSMLSERLKLPMSRLIETIAIHCTTTVNKKRTLPTQNAWRP